MGRSSRPFWIGTGLPRLSAQPKLYLGAEHLRAVDALGLPAEYCVIHRVSNNVEKDWSSSAWRELAAFVRSELDIEMVEVGMGNSHDQSLPLDAAMSLVNRLPVLQTAEVVRRARFPVGVDSAPAHFANALQRPGVVLLGRIGYFRQYNPYTGFYASGAPSVAILRNLVGPAHDLTVEEVRTAVEYVAAACQTSVPHATRRPTREASAPEWPSPPGRAATSMDSDAVLASGLFDVGWYGVHYPEAAETGLHPVDHYLTYGAAKGYNPGPRFDGGWYLRTHVDVAGHGMNPLVHYAKYGKGEGQPTRAVGDIVDGAPRGSSGSTGRDRRLSQGHFVRYPVGSEHPFARRSRFPRTSCLGRPPSLPTPIQSHCGE